MIRKIGVLAAAVVMASAVGIAQAGASATPVTGNVSCTLSGTATLKPGLPLTSPGTATKTFKTKISFTGTLSNCTGSQNGTKGGLQITGGSVKAKGTSTVAVGGALPSCLGLATPAVTPITLKSTTKFTNTTPAVSKTIAKSSAVLTLGTANLGPPTSFPAAGPVLKGAFLGQTATATSVLDLDATGLAAACSAPGGLTTLSFTGVQGPSTLVIP